jgi:N-acetylmuramoyl-L-alanine amidase
LNRRQDSGDVYVIARGDTLSAIAARYNVSVATLKRHNGITSETIRVGQRLKIPTS